MKCSSRESPQSMQCARGGYGRHAERDMFVKITEIHFKPVSFDLLNPVRVSFGCYTSFSTLIIRVETDEGIFGYGEAAPFAYVTGDDLDTSLLIGRKISQKLIGEDPIAIEKIHNLMDNIYAHNSAIKAAFDIALYDIAAKKMGVPLYKYLGGSGNTVNTDATIGIDTPEEMAKQAKEWVDQKNFNILKIKLGLNPSDDVARIAKIREAIGNDVSLRVDANQGWTVRETVKISKELEKYGVELIEQPVRYWDINGLSEIKRRSDLPVFADESCHSPVDAVNLIKNDAVDGINIKLMKCGGIYKANLINAIAESNGIPCMVGCMGESRIANTAGMHFVAAHKNVIIADLDTVFSIKCDWIKGGFTNEGNVVHMSDEPGLGITVEGF